MPKRSQPKVDPITLYAIRTVRVARYPPNIPCPFQAGAFMREDNSPYAGRSMRTCTDITRISFFETAEDAQELIDRCQYAAEFEVVSFKEVR